MPNYKGLLNKGVTAPWYKNYLPSFTRKSRVVPDSSGLTALYGTNISERPMPPGTPVPRLEQTPYGIQSHPTMLGINKNSGEAKNAERILNENFHQNFIRESISTFITSCAVNLNSPPNLSFLDDYIMRLRNPECSEIEAIYLYDRLISVFLMSSASIFISFISSRDFRTLYNNPNVRKTFDKAQEFLKPYTDKLSINPKVYQILLAITCIFYTAAFAFTMVATSGLISVAFAVILATTQPMLLAGAAPIISAKELSKYEAKAYTNFYKRCLTFSEACFKIMFSRDNAIKVETLQTQLKFWGIPQRAVDYIFETGQNYTSSSTNYINFLSRLSTRMFSLENSEISNIPFTKDIVDYHYTMYDYAHEGPFSRANKRRGKEANAREDALEADAATRRMALAPNHEFDFPPLPGNPFDGGSRRRRRRQKRKTRR